MFTFPFRKSSLQPILIISYGPMRWREDCGAFAVIIKVGFTQCWIAAADTKLQDLLQLFSAVVLGSRGAIRYVTP